MGQRIVLSNDIQAQYNCCTSVRDGFNEFAGDIGSSLDSIKTSFKRSGGQDVIISTCESAISKVYNAGAKFEEAAGLLNKSISSFTNLDASIRSDINNTEWGEAGSSQIIYQYYGDPNNKVGQSTNWIESGVYVTERFDYTGQCTWYACNRFNTLYPNSISGTPGNAKDWPNTLGKLGTVDVYTTTSWGDIDPNRLPCIAVDTSGNYGHVYIVEGVSYDESGILKDVYYSHANGYNSDKRVESNDSEYTEGIDGVVLGLSVGELIGNGIRLNGFIYAK